MNDSVYDDCFDSFTFGVDTTIGYHDFSDKAVIDEKAGYDEVHCEKATSEKWLNGDALMKKVPYLVG
jgi:hypothetical protein